MNKYQMKELRDLQQVELQVKKGVESRIKNKQQPKRNWLPYALTTIIAALAVFLIALQFSSNQQTTNLTNPSIFTLTDDSLDRLAEREPTYIETEIRYSGKEEATIESIEVVDENGNQLKYDNDKLAYEFFFADPLFEKDAPIKDILMHITELHQVKLVPNEEYRLIFNVLLNEQFKPFNNAKLKIVYYTGDEINTEYVTWDTLNQLEVEDFDFKKFLVDVKATPEEITAYNDFKAHTDYQSLASLSPISIARLYWFASAEGDLSTMYKLYINDEEYVYWTYEDIPPLHLSSPKDNLEYARQVSAGTFIQTSDTEGYISFTLKDSEDLTGFQMIKNKQGIWLVSFMPLQ